MIKMKYELEHNPIYGEEEALLDGVRVITADNASAYTFTGTRSYLLGLTSLAIIDPGPFVSNHLKALKNGIGTSEVTHIILTHSHMDHCSLAYRIAIETNAAIYMFGTDENEFELLDRINNNVDTKLHNKRFNQVPRIKKLADGDLIVGKDWSLEVIHTPGHYFDHICLACKEKNLIFSGDHVMGWSSTMISPPSGSMTHYISSLKKILNRNENLYLPGHGLPINDAKKFTATQIRHKENREQHILEFINQSPSNTIEIVPAIYIGLTSSLYEAAQLNVLAHLIDLESRNLISCELPISITSKVSIICKNYLVYKGSQ
jgi:glyoxylase-like metal-dependent hydrolase (beta-lactamase superfamily II)